MVDTPQREHERILDTIDDRDPDLAELLMRRHIDRTKRDFTELADG
jgi:DNA-binding GntR family transcriptional regulator